MDDPSFSDVRAFQSLARTHLFPFTWKAFTLLHPDVAFVPAWHVQAMVHALEQCVQGQCPRLLITIPPRHLKSVTASVALPAWWLGRSPSTKIMVASYGGDLAAKHARDFRALIESDFYRSVFPGTEIDPRRNTADEIMTIQRGGRKAISVGGAVTGFGADVLILDDLMKASDVHSLTERKRVRDYYDETLFSRLDDKSNGIIIAVQQRLHEDDIAGYLLDKGFEHLNLPAIAPDDEAYPLPLGRIHDRKRGDALCPEREPLPVLESIRREMGSPAFSAQYLQNSVSPEGNQLRWETFGTYETVPHRDAFLSVVQSWDTAHSAEPTADFSVGMTFGLRQDRVWLLLDVWRGRVEYPALKQQVLHLKDQWRADTVLIEYAGAGQPLVAELRQKGPAWRAAVQPYTPRYDKAVRFAAQIAKIEDGELLRPVEAPWLPALRDELRAFPHGRNDDQADALAQFLDWSGWPRSRSRAANPQHGSGLVRRDITRR